MYRRFEPGAIALAASETRAPHAAPGIPGYLTETYWWAYVHPRAVRIFDRQLLIDLILFGNYRRLREVALDACGSSLAGKTLQVACVYGDFSNRLAARLTAGASLDVVDVLPIQLANLERKLKPSSSVSLYLRNAAALGFADGAYDRAVAFFLLHEQPADVRRQTLAELVRVVKPGGRIVIVDYHRPRRWHPLRYVMHAVLSRLEPYALDLWRGSISDWLPPLPPEAKLTRRILFGGLYQAVVIDK